MRLDTVFEKTAAGEEAIRQRTRLVQRNLRMILILVDGKTDFATLSEKTGNALLTEKMLDELVSLGLIRDKRVGDSLWQEGDLVSEEIKQAKKNRGTLSRPSEPPQFNYWADGASQTNFGSSDGQLSVLTISQFSESGSASMGGGGASVTLTRQTMAPTLNDPEVGSRENEALPRKKNSKKSVPVSLGLGRKVQDFCTGMISKLPARSRESSSVFVKMWIVLGGAALLLVLFVGGLLLYPYSSRLPAVTEQLRVMFGQDVVVKNLGFSVYPKLGFYARDVELPASHLTIREMRLTPDWYATGANFSLSYRLVLDGGVMGASNLNVIDSLRQAYQARALDMTVSEFAVSNLQLELGGVLLNGLEGVIASPNLSDGQIKLVTPTKNIALKLTPKNGVIGLDLDAHDLQPFKSSKLTFDALTMHGFADRSALLAEQIDARVFDGVMRGTLKFVSAGEGEQKISGNLQLERVSLEMLAPFIGAGDLNSGGIDGTLRVLANLGSESGLRVEGVSGTFSVKRASLKAFDFAEAAKRNAGETVQGGAGSFDILKGSVVFEGGRTRFSDLSGEAGHMHVSGGLLVSNNRSVSGQFSVLITGSAMRMVTPVVVDGELGKTALKVGAKALK